MLTQDDIKNALKAVKYPGYSRDIVSFGLVKEISATQGGVSVVMQLTTSNPVAARQIKEDSERVLKALPGVKLVNVEVKQPAAGQTAPTGGLANQNRISGVKRVIAIASGKGGVGKSTCSVNLACALAQLGARVGLLDCDIYGPSIPLMMGVSERPTVNESEQLIPPIKYSVKVMSIGLLLDGDQPVGMKPYFAAPPRWHLWGLLGGVIWCTGTTLNFVASRTAIVGPATSYSIGQGATMVSAAWGVFVWHEFASAPVQAKRLVVAMFALFIAGLLLVALAPLY